MEKSEVYQLPKPRPKAFNSFARLIDGAVSGTFGLFIVFPLELVKNKVQNQQTGPKMQQVYYSIWDCFKKVYRSEGIPGLYKGVTMRLLFVLPEKGLKFASNDYFCFHFRNKNGEVSLTRQMLAAGMAGALQRIFTTPAELVRVQLRAMDQGTIRKSFMSIIHRSGVRGLYRGFIPSASRDICFAVVYFPLFTTLIQYWIRNHKKYKEPTYSVTFTAGCLAGSVAALVAAPFDVVKTRLQLNNQIEGYERFHGMFDCIRKTLRSEGVRGFFKGALCRMIVIVPLYGIIQIIYSFQIGEKILQVK